MRSLLMLSLITATGFVQNKDTTWNFDAESAGQIARGFSNDIGEWKVMPDSSAPSKPNALAQTAKSSGPTFNLALIASTNYTDLDLTVSMKAVAGATDQGGGMVWRATDAKNYYIARYNPLENNYRVYKVESGRRVQLANANIPASSGWHMLRVTMAGDHIECYYDGKKYLDVRDSTFKDSGKIGLWTKADAQTYFDDLRVTSK